MPTVLVTGAHGLIGSEAVREFCERGYDVVGIDNDMRARFFGASASTKWQGELLARRYPNYTPIDIDIRIYDHVEKVIAEHSTSLALVIHTAAQPSHDWAALEPHTDFTVNANGTLNLLEATRLVAPKAVFIFTSTNKVYGDRPNELPLRELDTRWEIPSDHAYREGIDESMSLDQTTHSLFGASKVAADVLVQEYGRYFGLKTGVFRGGCLTGPAHSGAPQHGFLAYLAKCVVTGTPYRVLGYQGKQVRDNIHSRDLISAFCHFFESPRCGEVYNIGGSRHSNCSMLEAIQLCEEISGKKLNWTYEEENRVGDHIWWISDVRKFQAHYRRWEYAYGIRELLEEIVEAQIVRAREERVGV